MEEEGSSLTPKQIPEKIGATELDLTLNQSQKSSDLHTHSIPGLQAQPVEQPRSCRGRGFNTLNMREQPPGDSPASAPQPQIPFLGVYLRQKLLCPPLFRALHILLWQRNRIFLAAAGDLETMEITYWLFFNTNVMWDCQSLMTIRLERAQLCSIEKLEKFTELILDSLNQGEQVRERARYDHGIWKRALSTCRGEWDLLQKSSFFFRNTKDEHFLKQAATSTSLKIIELTGSV